MSDIKQPEPLLSYLIAKQSPAQDIKKYANLLEQCVKDAVLSNWEFSATSDECKELCNRYFVQTNMLPEDITNDIQYAYSLLCNKLYAKNRDSYKANPNEKSKEAAFLKYYEDKQIDY